MSGAPIDAGRGETLLVLPGRLSRAAGVDARRIAAEGLASGLARAGGEVRMLDLAGLRRPGAGSDSVRAGDGASAARGLVRRLPGVLRPAVGDVAAIRADRAMAASLRTRKMPRPDLVVQYHHRFQRAAITFASNHGIPTILRVEALEVREEAAWGVRRPGYGGIVERWGELDILRRADLLAPVSHEIDRALERAGIPSARRVVVPNGVDIDAFRPGPPDEALRRSLGVHGRFVIGWIGGFRPFHGLDMMEPFVAALRARVPGAVLCLVGSGPTRSELEGRARALGDAVVVAGPVAHDDVPRWLRSFDACVLFSEPGAFHYSPLKLLEFMAAGRPVVAPAVGDLAQELTDLSDALVVPAGDPVALATSVAASANDPALAARLGAEARRSVERRGSWEARARAMLDALDRRSQTLRMGARRG